MAHVNTLYCILLGVICTTHLAHCHGTKVAEMGFEDSYSGDDWSTRDVFFNAKLTDHTKITSGHTVIFNKVIDNSGGGYSGLTGIFRAPSQGKYLFSLSVLSLAKANYVHIQVVKNGNEIGRVFAGSDAAHWPQMGSVTIVTHLEKGDVVYSKQMAGLTSYLFGNMYCSFSGAKI